MRKFLLALVILGAVLGTMLLLATAQNDGCFPWQERVGTPDSAFAETRGVTKCR